MILLVLTIVAVFSLGVGMFLGAWLRSMEEENEYHDALDSLKRMRGA